MLAALLILALAAPPAPLTCPKGAERKGDAPPAGVEQWCEAPDAYGHARRHGPARTWYDDGGTWVEQSFADGIVEGPYLERHRSGRPAREGSYLRGRKVGRWRVWFDTGVLEEESEWRDGVAHGRFAAFFPSGAPRTEGRYCGGVQCGRWRTFAEDGKPVGEVEYGEQRLAP